MKKFSTLILLTVLVAPVIAQEAITTFILVRHAEKADDGTNNPGLTEEGSRRAKSLVSLLAETKVDAIYSTPYKRTQHTVAPLAEAKNLQMLAYDPMKGEAMDDLLEKYRGGTIVLCGHSNTTPWIANYFLGKESYSSFEDSDYDNVLILSVLKKGQAMVTWLNYGAPSTQ
jgi:broad specificity phosphatase PhoE